MANTLVDPLAVAGAADVPNLGAPAAPLGGDDPGVNPFEGRAIPDQLQAVAGPGGTPAKPTPTPAPSPPPEADPFTGRSIPNDAPAQGTASPPATTATAAPSIESMAGIGAPPAAPSSEVNPFEGREITEQAKPAEQLGSATSAAMAAVNANPNLSSDPEDWTDLQRQVVGLPPKKPATNAQAAKDAAIETYSVVKDGLLGTVHDMANALSQGFWNTPGTTPGTYKRTEGNAAEFVPSTPEEIKSAQRGAAMLAVSAIPGAEAYLPAESFFAKTLIGKSLALSAQAGAAGFAYGAMAPVEEDQDRWDSMTSNAVGWAWQGPIFHGVFHALGWPVGKAIAASGAGPKFASAFTATGIPQRIAIALDKPDVTPVILQRAAQDVEDILNHVRANGANPADIPEPLKVQLVAMSIDNAVAQPDFASLDAKTQNLNEAAFKLQAPRDVNLDEAGKPAGDLNLQAPRDVALPEPGPGEGQVRIAQGVYQNPDGSVETYGYRGVGTVPGKTMISADATEFPIDTRKPTDPGMMGAIYMTPNPMHASDFGNIHYMGAKFKNPLVIDNWDTGLKHPIIGKVATELNDKMNTGKMTLDAIEEGVMIHPKFGDISFLGSRQPGIIEAARTMGHDGIIVRHSNETVEVVALHPSTTYSAGAADHVAAAQTPSIPLTTEQQLIQDKSARIQSFNGRPVNDLGTTSHSLTPYVVNELIERHANIVNPDVAKSYKDSGISAINRQMLGSIDDRMRAAKNGLYKLNDRVFEATHDANKQLQIQDVTGQIGRDPTIHPDVAKASLLIDAASKASVDLNLVAELGPTNQAAAHQLAGFEPAPRGFSTLSIDEKLHNAGRRAMDLAGFGNIDAALLDLTAPREIDLERPELSNPGGVRTKMKGGTGVKTFDDLSRLEQGLGPQRRPYLTNDEIINPKLGEAALDGRIFAETVDEHMRNALQMLQFEDVGEAAKRLRWAFEKNPVEAAKMMDKDSRLVKLNESPEAIAQRKLGQVKLQPWEQDLLKGYNQLLNTVKGQAPEMVERVQSYITETLENARARAAGAPLDGEDQVGMVHVTSSVQERAPWSPVPAGVAVPQMPNDWAMLARMEESLRNGVIEKVELPGVVKQPEPTVRRSSLTGRPLSTNKVGSANAMLIFRITSGGASGLLNIAAANTDDPATRKWLYMAGGVTAALAVMPTKDGWFSKTDFAKFLMRMNDLPALMKSEVGIPATDKLRNATDIANYFVGTAKLRTDMLRKSFPSKAELELGARALDNPNNAAVWGKLTPDQQQVIGREGLINQQMGQMLKARGIIDQFRDDYIRHIYPQETYNAWRSAKGSLSAGGFTKPRVFNTFDDAENWARANNLPGPILDIAHLQGKHLLEVGRAIMADQITKDMKGLGLLIDRNAGNIPVGWVTPSVSGMHDFIAPESVAIALERLGNARSGVLDKGFFKALDTVKGWQMRMVMAFPWIHGMNVARAALALDGTGVAYARSMDALKAADPSVARALKHGTLLFDRPDYAPQHAQGFHAMLEKVGSGLPDALNNVTFQKASNFLKSGESALWDKWVPALGLGSFNIEMHNWTERTGGRFAEGTPEFKAAARTAADNANIQMGKSLQMLKDPGLVYAMRQIFFAPQWMESRLRITAAALGEFRGVATGEIPLQEVKMLPNKVRALIIGATFTWIASKLWSGKAPQFNPNNSKYYIRTGVYDQNKREVGVDIAGWYADDIKLFSDPAKYFMNRLSPMIQATHTAISGRDAFGRSIGGLELADETINEFGPLGSMMDAAARLGLQGKVTGADAIKGSLATSDIGSSASLPRPGDLKLQAMAYQALQKYGLPTDDDRIYELQQMIGSNIRQGKSGMDGAVLDWLAFQRRSYIRQEPKSAGTRWLFRQTQHGLRSMIK